MMNNELEPFRQLLLKLKRDFQGDVDTLQDEAFHKTDGKAVGNLSNGPVEDRAERASDSNCDQMTLALVRDMGVRLGEIDAALERIADGTFGVCDKCGQEISSARLQTIPFARECVECARGAQQGESASPGNL